MLLCEVTERLKQEYSFGAEPLKFQFSGLGEFGNSVVFVKVKDGPAKETLHSIAGMLNLHHAVIYNI